jgi:hypothetical protein
MTFDNLLTGTVQSNALADAFPSPMPFQSYEGCDARARRSCCLVSTLAMRLHVTDCIEKSPKLVSFVIFFTLKCGNPLFWDGLPRKTLVASAILRNIQMSNSWRMGAGPRLKLLFGGGTKL